MIMPSLRNDGTTVEIWSEVFYVYLQHLENWLKLFTIGMSNGCIKLA